jgi:hypothetical protein
MPKILPNRSSKTLAEVKLEAIKAAAQVILDNLTDLVIITNNDFNALAKLGEILKPICDKVFEIAKVHPKYLEDEQPIEEVLKDKTYYEQLEIVRQILKSIIAIIEREQAIVGAEYRNAMANYESNVKERVKKGSTDARLVMDKLDAIDRGEKTPPPPPTPPASGTPPTPPTTPKTPSK